ncbi:hypothetical protein CDAR_230791 [Caerostris darwini]|uniref:Uncharacterized protein n=1 Tax=Caerostris darwini TaxID=1538125 RepID=A0AAV4S2M9_9ARAC|nr:hypothetical protein CDAR_230791 [Caerostris darwini]
MLVSSTSPRWDKNILIVVPATARVSKALTRVPFVQRGNGWYCLSRVAVGVAGHVMPFPVVKFPREKRGRPFRISLFCDDSSRLSKHRDLNKN